jgi:hypothetical protein
MANCGFCKGSGFTWTSTTQGGQQVILIVCRNCEAVVAAVPRK